MMVVSSDSFTFLTVVLFVVPIAMDLIALEASSALISGIRLVFIAFNVAFTLLGILGQFGMIIDKGESFAIVDTSLLMARFSMPKKYFAYSLCLDILVPVIMSMSVPTRIGGVIHTMTEETIGGSQK